MVNQWLHWEPLQRLPCLGCNSSSKTTFTTAATVIATAINGAVATANYLVLVIFFLKNSSNRDYNGDLTAAVSNY